jgi:hypothetical protein
MGASDRAHFFIAYDRLLDLTFFHAGSSGSRQISPLPPQIFITNSLFIRHRVQIRVAQQLVHECGIRIGSGFWVGVFVAETGGV